MKLVITSGHRVGSRWLHYLLSNITGQPVNPEMGEAWFATPQKRTKVASLIDQGKLIKFHGIMPARIYKRFPNKDIKIIAVVRNPRDRAVSYAFHNRYHDRASFQQKHMKSDAEAVEYTVYRDGMFANEERQQKKIMNTLLSTRNYQGTEDDYIWTCYEWLKEDIFSEVRSILDSANLIIGDHIIKNAIAENTFSKKSGRRTGEENRSDLWRRKGINGDWENWFTPKMIEDTQEEYDRYFNTLREAENEN